MPVAWRDQSVWCGRDGAAAAGTWVSKAGVPWSVRQQARRWEQPRVLRQANMAAAPPGVGTRLQQHAYQSAAGAGGLLQALAIASFRRVPFPF